MTFVVFVVGGGCFFPCLFYFFNKKASTWISIISGCLSGAELTTFILF